MSASWTPGPMSAVSSSTRPPSPRSQETPPSACKSTERRHQQLDITAENAEAASEYKFRKDENGVSAGVGYITEALIKGLSKQKNLACISSLNLSSPKDANKKFKYIKNLEKCSNLETLNLSNNQIEKIEKLDKVMKLRELNLSCNKISEIEGIEHMQKLQKLNLAGNEIEHIPVWVGKKLTSLRILNLKQNKVSSLHDIAKLKPLQDLTSLFLDDNPVVSLPHYRLYTIFHLRALENLDGQPVTNHDRQEALERFNSEEREKLERELENTVKEMENLKLNQSKVLEQLHRQDEVNTSLQEKTLQQKQICEDLRRDLASKNELLKQKTMELTQACQKQYELEQDLALYKIDAKFEPLNYFPSQISQAQKEDLQQQLSEKIQTVHQLHEAALELQKQMEKQQREAAEIQKELADVQSYLASVNPEDPRHAHMKAQKASKEQQFDVMNKHYKKLESRLEEMLSRIAKETEEIKDLEWQLTDGQIATNEALKRDLESIIIGLQQYLESIKCQAKQANDECKELQKDKESLLQRLADLEEERNNLEIVAMDAECMRNEIAILESALQEQREINESLKDAQGEITAHEAELETQLRERDAEASQQKEELERLKQLSQIKLSALQAALEKDRQALENALTKAQLAEEKEQQNYKLLSQLEQLQGDNNLLKRQLEGHQNQLKRVVDNLIHPEEVLVRVNELKQNLQTGAGEIKCQNSADVLGKSLANLQKEFNDILADAKREKEEAWARQRQLQEEMVSQQEKLEEVEENYRQVKAENRQNKNKVDQLENEIQHLHEKIKSMEEIQGLADQQLQEANEEKKTILAQLEDLEKRLKQKTMELTQACQKQYELEQDLALYKIDAKFEPLNYFPSQISQAQKEDLQQQLSEKIQTVHQLHEAALELQKQMEKQQREAAEIQKELADVQSYLASVNPEDPRHAHMKAQKASKEQQFDVMNKHYKKLESRLEEMLSRIAKETEEIKDLEWQLTDGQIATNEALKRDLESIIIGLQQYLESIKCQAKQANDECKELQKDKESLLQRLADLEEERNNLDIVAMDAECMRNEIAILESALQEQREINESLKDAQGEITAYEAELETQLRERDAEASQQKEELERLKLSQIKLSALQAALEKDRQALENALTKAQLAEEKEQQNYKLLSQLEQLQGDNNLLKRQLEGHQNQLKRVVDNLIHPEEVLVRVNELKQNLQTGAGEIKCQNSADVLGKSLANLQKEFNDILADAKREKEEAWARQRQLQEEMVSQQEKLEEVEENYRQVKAENRQNKNKVDQLENEIQHLHEKIKSMEEIQGLADQQLQEANEEKKTILAQLEDLEKRLKQKTMELTQACQKQYELEQDLALYKIDAKFEPLNYFPSQISQAQKEDLQQQLSEKIQTVHQLHEAALELQKQMEKQQREAAEIQKELADVQSYLASVNPEDPRHAHMKAQKASKEQQFDVMNKHYKKLESRLEEMLSRIAKETEEIKDLERQLTDGQIATNEALKRDLESIIIGLQQYLESIKCQAKQANDECKELQKDKESLLQRLADLEEERNNLEIVAMDAECMRNEIAILESALQEQREINESLKDAQGEITAYEAELETQLRERDAEASQQKEELERLKQLSQIKLSALQAALEKDRQALENALTKAQLAEEKEQQNYKLLSQLEQLQGDNNLLKRHLEYLQNQLKRVVDNLIHPEEVLVRVNEIKEKLQTGAGEIKCQNSADVLGKSLAYLQKEFNDILADAKREKEEAWARQRQLQEEMVSQQEKLEEVEENYRQVKAENRQNKNKVDQLENEIQHLHEKIKSMEEIQGLADQQLQEANEEKKTILAQLEDLEKRETEEAEEFCAEAARAAQDLARAEAEIELLQQLLKEKEEQFQHEMEKAGENAGASSSRKFEIDKLNEVIEQQKAEIDRLRWLLDSIGTGNQDEMDNLQEETAALENVLSYQNDYITSLADPLKRRGYWYYMPSSQVSTPASRSTKNSGVSLLCSGTSPLRRGCGQDRQCRKEDLCSQGGCCVYSPIGNRLYRTNSGKDRRVKEDSEENKETRVPKDPPFVPPPGTVIYTVLPDGAPVPQGTVLYGPPPPAASGVPIAPGSVIYGPPPVGAQVVYGPLPPNFTVPLVPVGVLHCNVPEHHDLESEVSRLEDTVYYLKSQKYKDKESEAAEQKCKKEVEKLHQNFEELLHEREELEHKIAELRRAAEKHNKRKDFTEGYTGNLIAELQLEKSLKHHEDIADKIECLEKTLLKRRAELREADRLLSEAEVELESTRGKTKDTVQKYNRAKQRLSRTETEAKELERRAREMAVELVKAERQLRLLQTDTRDLEQCKREQEGVLEEINKMVAARDSEFQSLNQKVEVLTESLQKLQGDIKVAEGNKEHHLQILREAENLLQGKKAELERLKDQIIAQQQEFLFLEQQLNQRKEDLRVLQDSISQKKGEFEEALRDGETEANEKLRQIREIKLLLEELNAERKELDVQINEKRAQLSFIKKDIGKGEENLHEILGQITKHKIELKHALEMLELENKDLQGLKVQHDRKVNELEKTQVAVLEEKLKLENTERLFQCQQREVDWQEQLLQKGRQENEHLVSQMRTLQNNIESLNKEKEKLEDDCQSLEKKLSQTRRDLTAAEDSSRTALSNVEKMELDVTNLQQEVDLLNKQKKSLDGDIIVVQKDLQEKKEELETLKGELNDSRQQLQLVEQDLENHKRHQDELLREQAALREDILEYLKKHEDCQERQKKRENQLQQLEKEIEERETEVAKQEAILHHLKENSEREGKKLEECTAKVKDQKILLEKELTDQQKKQEQAVAKVRLAEENLRKLEKESRYAALEEAVRQSKRQLSEKELHLNQKNRETQSLQKELEVSKSELSRLQDQIASERKEAEKQMLSLKEAMTVQRMQLERKLLEQKHENNCLQSDTAAAEAAAHRNHEQAKRLAKDLGQIQQDYMDLHSQVRTQGDPEKRQKEMENAATLLKLEAESEVRMGFKYSRPSSLEPLGRLEASSEGSLQCGSGNFKETGLFAAADKGLLSLEGKLNFSQVFSKKDEQWRGEVLREKLQRHEDQLKVRLELRMSKQAEVLMRGKRQMEGTLQSLKRQVDVLDDLVSSMSAEPLFLG